MVSLYETLNMIGFNRRFSPAVKKIKSIFSNEQSKKQIDKKKALIKKIAKKLLPVVKVKERERLKKVKGN